MNEASRPVSVDLLVLGGIVLTMDAGRTVLADGGIAVRDGAIVAVGPRDAIARAHTAATVVEARGDLVIPGLVDGHTHVAMTLFRGLADDLPLHTWLERHVWPAERRFIHPDTVTWGSRLGVAELVRSGVTTLCDMYFFEDEVAAVVDELGVRGVLGQAFFDFTSPQGLDVDANVAYATDFVARWRGHDRVVPALAPHAPYTVSPDLYRRLHALAEKWDVPVVTHLAETQEEHREVLRRHGRSPVRHLASLGLLDPRLVAAHCVWVDGEEIALLAAGRAGVVHNPRSNLKLASGIAPVPDMLRAGVVVGLGTDGAASNNELDLLAEIQFAALLHKGVRLDPLAVPASVALEMATIGGARALGLDAKVGSLEVGKRADLVIIDLDEDSLVPLYDPVSHLAYAIESADVRTVIVDGRIVVADGALLTADDGEIRRRVRALATDIGSLRGGTCEGDLDSTDAAPGAG
jgi:5-methylthioadenosine/S-adenosylhomocysteine deaminase